MRPQIALTGATGFVGQTLLRRLRSRGTVRALVRDPQRLSGLDGVEAVAWEAGRADPAALEGISVLCHLAACVPRDLRDPDQAQTCVQVNALGTLDLLRAARAARVEAFLYMSSGNIYAPSDRPASEDAPIWPSGAAAFYLSSKALGDLYVAHAHARGWFRGVQLRPSAIYGPGMKGGVVSSFARSLRARQPIRLQDGGRHRVDLVSVDDVVDATLAALDRPVHGPLNIGSGRATTVGELARILAGALSAPPDLIEVEPPGEGPPTGFAPLDIGRARKVLGYGPLEPAEGLSAFAVDGA